jgi:hypothetical protein
MRGVVTTVVAAGVLIGLTAAVTACARPVDVPRPATVAEFLGPSLTVEDFGSFGQDRLAILASDDERFAAVLRVRYPAGSASEEAARTGGTPEGGAQLYARIAAGSADDVFLRYFVRFPDGFNFVRGGKLPGLFGGRVTGGKKIPDGTNGFSTRYMWRADGLGEVYAYLPSSREHGTSLGRGAWSWPTGSWVSIQQQVRLNTPGRADGRIRVWLNGTLVLEEGKLEFRSSPSLRVDGLFFSTFFGGDDAGWATPTDQYAEFAGFTISDHFISEDGS